ncbi:Carbon monoxide dehydrogenase subunit G [Streptomyces zhaozhouensis]|uniref:Carbon monoxide dehydrogenase subunit G n=1 Tax=Streptomyces zhaozhouensis TaxID=1300267 RepID=A0A286DV17_9ACTN|nr:hypothetical protein [Streptomyces zhaozhouensis]SOD62490.1 Carbon monoxide dehydrogenase subunit G [Streptomyces zhaozhouensis]
MEHEVYLPYAPAVVLSAVAEPRRLARCVPGLQPAQAGTPADREAAPDAVRGRLRLRVGSSTITYRGTLTVAADGEGGVVRAEGEEARGAGTATLELTVTPRPVDGGAGCALAVEGRLTATGRLAELSDGQRESAGRRLLDRFAAALADELSQEARTPPATGGGIGEPDDNERAIPGIPAAPGGEPPAAAPEATPGAEDAGEAAGSAGEAAGEPPAGRPRGEGAPGAGAPTAPRAESPAEPAASEPLTEPGAAGGRGEGTPSALDPERAEPSALPAPEADHARRTMIGRSAEEVDHAPPRGRYAPEPAPEERGRSVAVLRWAAPAAALAVASAVALRRVLRRR